MNQHPVIPAPLKMRHMRELPETDLADISEELGDRLADLGLKAYVNPMDPKHYWFGLPDAGVPEHDRWFFMVNVRRAHGGVGTIPYFNVLNCTTEILEEGDGWNSSQDLMDTLWTLNTEINDALDDAPQTLAAAFKTEERRLKIMLMFQAFGFLGIDFSNELLPLAWDQELHDLIHHYDAWVSRNPEAADLPQDLVLRMHGLQDYAAHLTSGLDWRVKHEPDAATIALLV